MQKQLHITLAVSLRNKAEKTQRRFDIENSAEQ